MDLQLNGKSALVTGSTAGIGLAIAKLLAREGAAVIVNGRTRERVDAAVAEIKKEHAGAEVRGINADVSSAEGVARLISQVPAIDILINNAGIYQVKPFPEITDQDWQHLFETNVMSGIRLSRFYLPKMLSKNWGRIIFISSESAVQTPLEMIHYGFTKTAQLAISRGLAEMTAGTQVTVNSVLPGPTASEGVEKFVGDMAKDRGVSAKEVEKEFFASVRPSSLIKRFATPEEIANLVAYVASPLSSATNGTALRADGGVIRSIL
ncbi:MAG: SDR family NAD(P)-dependent oxidoreductase [Planctomycetota bacterium]|nr:SDR family NAD(P)-dependent oxidoreductase [Planctomycetota bacterium]